jgi:hypothetical protein
VVQKIKGAQDVKLSIRGWISGGDSLLKILNNSNDKTLQDIENLRKMILITLPINQVALLNCKQF